MQHEEKNYERSRSPKNESSRGENYGPGSFYGGEGHGRSGGYGSDRDDSTYGRTEQKSRSENNDYPRSERSRSGRGTEYFEDDYQPVSESHPSDSPWRDTYQSNSHQQERPRYRDDSTDRDYNESDRSGNPRGSQYGSYRGYNDSSYSDRERDERYRSGRHRSSEERLKNNYDNQDESMEDENGFRERYNDNRY